MDSATLVYEALRPESFTVADLGCASGTNALGVVEAINGARRLNCRFTGEAGHAGTVPMSQRRDALAAAAEWMVLIETTTRQHGGNLVATVGTLRCAPGAVNVIPGEVALTLDIRGPQDGPLDALLTTLLDAAQAIAARRHLRFAAEADRKSVV